MLGVRRVGLRRIGLLGKAALAAAAAYYVAASIATGSPVGMHLIHAAVLSASGLVAEAATRQRSIAVDEETVILLDTSGLDDRDREILRELEHHGPMGVSEVARRLGISKSVVSRKLKKLAEMGLVEKVVVRGRPLYAAKT